MNHPKRTGYTIHAKTTRLPNTSHLGYDKWKASRGDLVKSERGFGVVLGTVEGERKKYLLVVQFDECLTHAFELWLKPEEIQTCQANAIECVPAWAADPDFWKLPADMILNLLNYGTVGRGSFGHWRLTEAKLRAQIKVGKAYREAQNEGNMALLSIARGDTALPAHHARQAASAYHRMKRLEKIANKARDAYEMALQSERYK